MTSIRQAKAKHAEDQKVFRVNAGNRPARRPDGAIKVQPRNTPSYRGDMTGSVLFVHLGIAKTFRANLKRAVDGRYVWCPFARQVLATQNAMEAVDDE